jgi:two-component system heavy metal sensor histidine kinase CusS
MEFALALDELRMSGSRRLAVIRLWGVLGFLGLSAVLGVARGQGDWLVYIPILAPYALLSAVCWQAIKRRQPVRLLRNAMPFADVLLVYLLQHQSLPISPHPAGVAGFSLGLFVFVELLSSLTLTPRLILAVAGASWICEAALQHQAEVGAGAILASGFVLLLSAGITVWSARRLEELVDRTVAEEVALRVATEQRETLEAANRALEAAKAELESKHNALEGAQREAESLSRLLVHDLKGPLTTIMCYTSLVREQMVNKPELQQFHDDLGIADVAGQRMLDMIGDILSISRLERRNLELQESEVDVVGLLREVARSCEAAAKQKGVQLHVSVAGSISARLDRELSRRMLENLAGNALRFLRRGGNLQFAASVERGELRLAVRNDGPVIPEAVQATLFEKFGSGEARRGHNAGLGLYFCRLATEAHGGVMALEKVEGWNVSFAATFPRARAVTSATLRAVS